MNIGPLSITWRAGDVVPPVHDARLSPADFRAALREHAAFVTGALDDVLCEQLKQAAAASAVPHSLLHADAQGRPVLATGEELHRRAERIQTLSDLRLELARLVAEANRIDPAG